jgi:8-oxo-dGTP diphosphatase
VATAGAAAIVFDNEGRVLLVREGYGRHRWSLPGGRMDEAELPHETAVREAREETGLDVWPIEIVGLYRFHGEREFDVYAFRCGADGAAVADGNEIAEIAWADPSALPTPMTNLVASAVPDAAAGNRGLVRRVEWKPMRHESLAPVTA